MKEIWNYNLKYLDKLFKVPNSGIMNMEDYHRFSTKEFENTYSYHGNDLGALWTKERTSFRVWAPTADEVILNLYQSGDQDDLIEELTMKVDGKGTWTAVVDRDLNGIYYTYTVTVGGKRKEAVDPYAKAVGVNGDRGMVVDLSSTDPDGFASEKKPDFIYPTDAIIYEIHVRDFSVDISSGMEHKGKYLAFCETGTTNFYGDKTGLDHLKELGVTHIHLLPIFDYATIDESRLEQEQFNWGYDPKNYNAPEGSYSTDPYHGDVRIRELKQMIYTLHQNGIRVIMDVVYNHTYSLEKSNFQAMVPGYYYRMTPEGKYSDASACGNETASERTMMRKYIVDSVVYWAKEYHMDGFRFDLMGVHDMRTMEEIRSALNQLDPSIMVYGEGWTGGDSPLPFSERATKANIRNMDSRIAAFSDDIRDGIKGSVFSSKEQGFISGREGMEDTIKFGVSAAVYHNQISYNKLNYSKEAWAKEPSQTIQYVSAHDNLTLWDKLTLSNPMDTVEDRTKMNLLSAAILMTAQGVPFFQAGEEFLRSKPLNKEETEFEENSYRSPDFVNSIKWDRKTFHREVFDYYKGLLAFRKAHKALRLDRAEEIRERLRFLEIEQPNVIAYTIAETTDSDRNSKDLICIILNANREKCMIKLPFGEWMVYAKGKVAGCEVLETFSGDSLTVEPISAIILRQERTN